MNIHKNARMTMHGRALLVSRILNERWRVADAARAAGVSERVAYKWLARYRTGGAAALDDRKPTPGRCPHATPAERVAAIEELRRERLSGPAIARRLAMPRSTVGAVLRRLGLGRLAALDRKPPAQRYERQRPGELIHIDTKKLGKIDGVGHRITGQHSGMRKNRGIGWEHLHVAVDDASRLAYTEILPDERKESACAFLTRALAFFKAHGVTVERVMTDNGSAYRSHLFKSHRPSRPPAHPHQALYAPNQRQGRALHPDLPARMGLSQSLPHLRRAHPSHDPLDHRLQPQPTPFSPQRPPACRKAEQCSWIRHLSVPAIWPPVLPGKHTSERVGVSCARPTPTGKLTVCPGCVGA
jgi:transposase